MTATTKKTESFGGKWGGPPLDAEKEQEERWREHSDLVHTQSNKRSICD